MNRGHLEQRPGGKWRFRAPGLPAPDGKRRPHSKTFVADTHKEAEKVATKLLAEWDRDDEDRAAVAGTVGGLIDDWVAFKSSTWSPTTVVRNAQILDVFRAELGPIKLADLTARHIDMLYRKLSSTQPTNRHTKTARRAPATIQRYHRVLRAVLQQGEKWDMLDRNVADKSTPPKVPKTTQAAHVPTVAALQVMLSQTSVTNDLRLAVLLASATGARRGELVALRWSDLQGNELLMSRALVKVPGKPVAEKGTKSGVVKAVPLPTSMVVALHAHREWQRGVAAGAMVRPATDGRILADLKADASGSTPHPPDWLSGSWERMCARAGVHFKFHGLRHMHGSLLVDAGTPLATVAKRQGHSMQVAGERYVHPVEASDLAAAVTIGELLAPLFAVVAPRCSEVAAGV